MADEKSLIKKTWKLPRDFAENWLKDLRSGNFNQGSEHLYQCEDEVESFCCLGVAGVGCSIPRSEMHDIGYLDELFDYSDVIPAVLREKSIYVTAQDETYNLPMVLALLNDGFTGQDIIKVKKTYPRIYYHIEADISKTVRYSFEDIAIFIENNIEFVDEINFSKTFQIVPGGRYMLRNGEKALIHDEEPLIHIENLSGLKGVIVSKNGSCFEHQWKMNGKFGSENMLHDLDIVEVLLS